MHFIFKNHYNFSSWSPSVKALCHKNETSCDDFVFNITCEKYTCKPLNWTDTVIGNISNTELGLNETLEVRVVDELCCLP